ncbi:MAG: response regulator [Planctomycetes bacterium]|nr:response regulator [Planctomycetota bacterium]
MQANSRPLVLVVDDSRAILDALRTILDYEGCDVIEAENAEDGIQLAKDRAPSIVFLDIMLKGIDGIACLQKLKKIPETREIPVMMLTAVVKKETIVTCIKNGAADYIIKPFDVSTIRKKLDRFLPVDRYDFEEEPTEGKGRILIVDDESNIREIFSRALEDAGYLTDVAADGVEGFRKVRDSHFDLVVCDLVMPGWKGDEVIESLTLSHVKTKIIIVSGFVSEEVKTKFRANPLVSGIYQKPVGPEEIVDCVNRTLRKATS